MVPVPFWRIDPAVAAGSDRPGPEEQQGGELDRGVDREAERAHRERAAGARVVERLAHGDHRRHQHPEPADQEQRAADGADEAERAQEARRAGEAGGAQQLAGRAPEIARLEEETERLALELKGYLKSPSGYRERVRELDKQIAANMQAIENLRRG